MKLIYLVERFSVAVGLKSGVAIRALRLKNNETTGQLNVNNWLVVSNCSLEVRQVKGAQWKL